ncbi:MAG: cell division protein SepF [Peptococcaceae bacterium]|nr:cell division protein SepF [Peptococcaceae bacterium]
MGFEDELPDREPGQKMDQESYAEPITKRKGAAPVVSIHSQRQVRVCIVEPRSFDEVQDITENLKNGKPVIVNLEHADSDVARRIVDFVSGATYALNGSLQKVGGGIFLFVPSNVNIDSEIESTQKGGLFPWIRSKE